MPVFEPNISYNSPSSLSDPAPNGLKLSLLLSLSSERDMSLRPKSKSVSESEQLEPLSFRTDSFRANSADPDQTAPRAV